MATNQFGMHNNPSKYGAIGKTFTNHLNRMPGSNSHYYNKFYEGRNFMMDRWDNEIRNAKSAYDRQEIQKRIDWANKTRPWEREVRHGGSRARNAEGYYNGLEDQYNAYAAQNSMYRQNAAQKAQSHQPTPPKPGMATGPIRYDNLPGSIRYNKRPMRERNDEIEMRRMQAGMPNRFGGGFK